MTNSSPFISRTEKLEELSFQRPEKRFCKVLIWSDWISFVLLSGLAIVGYFLLFNNTPFGTLQIVYILTICLILGVGLATSLLLIKKVWNFRGYALRDKDITIRKGIFFPSYTTISIHKIQSVEINQNPILRLYQLYKVNIINGAQTNNTITINGINKTTAEAIKSYLTQRLNHEQTM